MTNTNSGAGEPGEIQAQIDRLRAQVDALMGEHETRMVDRATCADSLEHLAIDRMPSV